MSKIVPSQVVEFIDQIFPDAEQQESGSYGILTIPYDRAPECRGILDMLNEIPPELINLSGKDYSNYIAAKAAVKIILHKWINLNSKESLGVMVFGDFNPITMIRIALGKCDDMFPSKDVTKLKFIRPKKFRQDLEIDISSAYRSLANGEFKAAIVLAGSVIESLLLWSLEGYSSDNNNSFSNLENGTLGSFKILAFENNIITEETVKAIDLAQDFRNLIHPGREKRLNQKCTIGRSHMALGAVGLIIEDLKNS